MFPLGIIVNEFITNSMRYAFDSKKSGKIDIFLTRNANKVILTIYDNGKGLADDFDIDKSIGFGLDIVKMLAEQLNGTFEIKSENGTECILKFEL